MGRWSRHPMGSDGALDARDTFMADFDIEKEDGKTTYFFERPKEEIREGLLKLSLKELEKRALRRFVNENRFVIPYTFIDYEAYPTDPKIKEFLLDCLNYCEDFEEYGNGEEYEHVDIFIDNFEDIISGKKILEKDGGLLAAFADKMESGETGLINKTNNN